MERRPAVPAQPAHIVAVGGMPLLERDQDLASWVPRWSSRLCRQDEDPLRHADVVDDSGPGRAGENNLANLASMSWKDALGGFDAVRRRGADVKLDLAAVNGREESRRPQSASQRPA